MVYNPCPNTCPSVFDRVVISYLIRGGTTVMWELLESFTDPLPYTFALQVGATNDPEADDWEQIGLAAENVFYMVDPDQRVWGKTNWTSYRVQLTTPVGVYYSDPTDGRGTLNHRDWRLAREYIRKEKLRNRLCTEDGYLLKRRITGTPCTKCLDPQTEEVLNPDCLECFGTGYQCGFYSAMPCVWADMSPRSSRIQLDGGEGRGTIDDIVVKARMLMAPLMVEDDVWVNKKTDDRYFVHKIDNIAESRGVPLIADVELRPAAFSHIIYSLEIPDEIAMMEDC